MKIPANLIGTGIFVLGKVNRFKFRDSRDFSTILVSFPILRVNDLYLFLTFLLF